MMKLRKLAVTTVILAFAATTLVANESKPQTPVKQTTSITSALDSEYRLSQTATCIHDGKRYNKGARICMAGVYNYCNARGLWEPSNQKC